MKNFLLELMGISWTVCVKGNELATGNRKYTQCEPCVAEHQTGINIIGRRLDRC